MKEKQLYHSSLREEQMKRTREQILEGLTKVIASGVAELSMPAVAREAGVSVPTVYRYFPSKRELLDALGGHLMSKLGIPMTPPRSPEELVAMVKQAFISLAGQDEAVWASSMTELSMRLRKDAMPARVKATEDALAPVRAQFNERDWQRLRNVVLVLASSSMVRAFKVYLDLDGEEAADCVAWAILTLAHAASPQQDEAKGVEVVE